MTTDYRNFIMPRDGSFLPSPERICALVERLRAEHWVLSPDDAAFLRAWTDVPGSSDHRRTGGWAETLVEKPKSPRERRERSIAIPIPVEPAWISELRRPESAIPQADELALNFLVSSPDESWDQSGLPYPFAYGSDEPSSHNILIYAARDFVLHPYQGEPETDCPCGVDLAYEVDEREMLAPIDFSQRVRAVCPSCARPFDATSSADGVLAFRFAVIVDCGSEWPKPDDSREPEEVVAALRRAGYFAPDPPSEQQALHPDRPHSSRVADGIVRNPYGDPAPPVSHAFLRMIEATIGKPCFSEAEFY